MTTTLRSSIHAKLAWTWDDRVGSSLITDSNRLAFDKRLANGAEADQADAVWHADGQSLASGESTTLDLDALAMSCFGDTILIPLAKVKAVLLVNTSAPGSGYLLVGGAAVDEWHAPFGAAGDTVKVMPDCPLLLCNSGDGWEVAAGAASLQIAAVEGGVTYDVAILGTLVGDGDSSSSSSSGG